MIWVNLNCLFGYEMGYCVLIGVYHPTTYLLRTCYYGFSQLRRQILDSLDVENKILFIKKLTDKQEKLNGN